MINVGPTKEGTIVPIFEERLRQMGEWLEINGESIYSTVPWTYQNDTINPDVWYTSKADSVYAILLKLPQADTVVLGAPFNLTFSSIKLLGFNNKLDWKVKSNSIVINVPDRSSCQSKWAWVFELTNVSN